MAMRKLQLTVTEEQHRRLKQRAGEQRSLAQVVRDLIDEAGRPDDPESDPFYLMTEKERSGRPYLAEQAKRALYRRPR